MADAVGLTHRAGEVRLGVRVKPSGRRDRLLGPHGGALKVEVKAAPERGKANDAVVRLLAKSLGASRSQVEIVAGHGSRTKTLAVSGLSVGDVVARLDAMGIPTAVVREP